MNCQEKTTNASKITNIKISNIYKNLDYVATADIIYG